jgi:uncharacterized protein
MDFPRCSPPPERVPAEQPFSGGPVPRKVSCEAAADCRPIISGALPLRIAQMPLQLLPDRAVWLDELHTLVVADIHLGKAETFRRSGIPVPGPVGQTSLDRLSALIRSTCAKRLWVLGDLLHGPAAHEPAVLDALLGWTAEHRSVQITLVRGNHDARAGDLPASSRIHTVAEPARLGGFVLMHEPPAPSRGWGGVVLAGHVHPVFGLRSGADRLRLACWWRHQTSLVLPAFGEFTGGHRVDPACTDGVFVTDGSRVYSVPLPVKGRRSGKVPRR